MTPTRAVVGAVVRAELTRLARDRTAAFFFILVPFLVILLVGLSFSGEAVSSLSIGVTAPDTPLAARLVERLDDADALSVQAFDDEADLQQAVRRQTVLAGVVVPADHDARTVEGAARVALVTGPQGTVPAAVQGTVEAVVAEEGAAVAAVREGLGATDAAGLLEGLATVDGLPGGPEVAVRQPGAAGEVIPAGFAGSAARNLVLFLFITSLIGGSAVVQVRRLGIVHRAMAAPTSPVQLLLGEATAWFLVTVGQGLLVVGGSAVLFGVEWRSWPATLAVAVLFALAGTGASMVVGAVFSSDQQVESVGPPVGIALGMLGGCMWPLEIVPPVMRAIGHLTPHAWAVDALNAVQGRGAGLAEVTTELAALAGFAVGLTAIAALLLRRVLTRA